MKILARAAIWPLAVMLACATPALAGPPKPVAAPSSYVPQSAVAYGEPGGAATPVTAETPLPVICIVGCSGSGGGGTGGPTSIADGADQALGAKSDAAWSGTGNGSLIAIMKAVRGQLAAPLSVTGTFWQATQPVSIAALPLPSGAATASAQAAANGYLATIASVANSDDPTEVVSVDSTPYFNGAGGATLVAVGSGGQVLTDYYLENPDAETKAYLQFFSAASAGDVTLGVTPPVRSIGLDGGEKANLAGLALAFPLGLVIAATSTPSGASAPATPFVVNLGVRGY